MKLSVLTLFPELIESVLNSSVIGRARTAGLFELEIVQIRDFAVNQYGKVDDACYGGGTGMLMMAEPIYQAWCSVTGKNPSELNPDHLPGRLTVYCSPRGQVFHQEKACELVKSVDHLVLICGHYEGVDQRVIDLIADVELSIGDYVITGGELAACVIADAVLRLVPGVLPDETAYTNESHMDHLLEHPQYTRPAEWRDRRVPDVLMSGHQAKIESWKFAESVRQTLINRPDLIRQRSLDEQTWQTVLNNWRNQSEDDQASETTKSDKAG